jgi:SAM-dependent methyltransferase
MSAFSLPYADAYDALHAFKDYDAECDMLERVFAEFGVIPVRRILDLGCGTGGHAVLLGRRGYEVIGVDRSTPMIELARAKARVADVAAKVRFLAQDITTPVEVPPCDAAVMMFAVLGYLAEEGAAAIGLRAVRTRLRQSALLVFDVWYAPAVMREPPQDRWRMGERNGLRLLRLTSGNVRADEEVCEVEIRLLRIESDRIVDETVEQHRVRYYSRDAITRLLAESGFELVRLGSFPEYREEPGASGWSVAVIARAV